MANMFKSASSFNQSLHSSHNNTPLSNLDGLQIQSKQKTNTEDEINQRIVNYEKVKTTKSI